LLNGLGTCVNEFTNSHFSFCSLATSVNGLNTNAFSFAIQILTHAPQPVQSQGLA
jgi:hypothetical protein